MARAAHRPALRHIIGYGAALAALSFLLEWIDYRHAVHRWSTDFYMLVVALVFAVFGGWLALRLLPRQTAAFERNDAAIAQLGISGRELEVLEKMAGGASNKVIARTLGISPNTVKTHVANLFAKLEANNRTEAVAQARDLRILP